MTRGARSAAAAVALALAAAAGPARAQEPGASEAARPAWLRGAPPAGWAEMAGLARNIGTGLRQSQPFGALPTRAGAAAHAMGGQGAFYLSWAEADQAPPAAAEALRGALDRVRANRLASSPEAHSTEELRYAERVSGGVAQADLEWRHLSNETLSLVRAFAWVSADGKPRLASAECVIGTSGGKAPPDVEKTCRDALAAVAVAAPAGGVGALAALPPSRTATGAEPVADGEPGTGAASAATVAPGPAPPTMAPAGPASGGRVLYRGPPSPPPESKSKWIILFGAAMLVGALYLAVRSRRSRPGGDDDDEGPASGPEKTQ